MKNLQGKKVLLIATAFFGYEVAMKRSLERLGANVVYYDERVIRHSFEKALLKISPFFFKKRTIRYFERIVIDNYQREFDYLYVYGATMIDEGIVALLKEGIHVNNVILYLADSVKGNKRYEKMFPLFDKVATYDRGDYDFYKDEYPHMCFLPLFYSEEYNGESVGSSGYKYDISFVGTIHSDRVTFLDRIKEQAEKEGLKVFYYGYLQGKFMFYFRFFIDKDFRKKRVSDFQYKKLSANEVRRIIEQSRCVVDAQHPKNKGLTMRTFETLGMHRKLITANNDIVNYDFYKSTNIAVVDRNFPKISKSFIMSPYEDVPVEIQKKYYIDQWTLALFSLHNSNK